MTFALLHATLGWGLASLTALVLRHRSADARCWAWRFGLLKGPLALLLAVPIVVPNLPSVESTPSHRVAISTPTPPVALLTTPGAKNVATPVETQAWFIAPDRKGRPLPERLSTPPTTSRLSLNAPLSSSLLLLLYALGVVATLVFRFTFARRYPRWMPRVEGVLSPRIVVPDGLDPQDAAMARAHEEAHVHRRDPLWSLIADLVCVGLWFAPPVWLCARGVRAESEAACDAAALEATCASRKDYARLLLAHAGSAPANALGGSARRLARRILMLEKTVKPIPRLAVAALLVLGGIALTPWRARAAPVDARTSGRRIVDLFPFRISFRDAMLAMLNEPGVKAKIAFTPDQQTALSARQVRIDAILKPSNARMKAYRQTHSQRDSFHFDDLERAKTEAEVARIAGSLPLTPDQEAKLRSITLTRVGSAIWFDPAVSGRLALTLDQKHSLLVRERAILDRLYRDPKLEKAYLPLPKTVSDRSVWLQYKIFTALPQDRPAFQRRQDELLRPYRKGVPHLTATQRKEQSQARIAKGWRLLGESQPKVVALLTATQRETLRRLESDPSAWQAGSGGQIIESTAPHSSGTTSSKPLIPGQPAAHRNVREAPVEVPHETRTAAAGRSTNSPSTPKDTDKPVNLVPMRNGFNLKVNRDGAKPPFGYRVDHVAPTKTHTESSGQPPTLTASTTQGKDDALQSGSGVHSAGRLPEASPPRKTPGDFVKTIDLPDGSGWNIYRSINAGDKPMYFIEHVPAPKGDARTEKALFAKRTGEFRRSLGLKAEEELEFSRKGASYLDYTHDWIGEAMRRSLASKSAGKPVFRSDPHNPNRATAIVPDAEGLATAVVLRERAPNGRLTYRVIAQIPNPAKAEEFTRDGWEAYRRARATQAKP